ncbi:response regulator [Pontibacterium sp.]|uniref:response regulator n=1 Tax=Pontibacterium sp. TaxID=2036026 RepID=UPI0035160391
MTEHSPTILIAEDEQKLARLLSNYLQAQGYQCHHVDRGDMVEPWLADNHADLLLLDIMMPGKDGVEVCRGLREHSDIPIIILTARVQQVDELLGLDLGADDYICKPFQMVNVEARIRATLRRVKRFQTQEQPRELIELLSDSIKLRVNGHDIQLTASEYRLLEVLHNHKGQIFSRGQLLDRIHDDHRVVTDRTIDTLVKSIRKKISAVYDDRVLIHSVYAMGYKLEI